MQTLTSRFSRFGQTIIPKGIRFQRFSTHVITEENDKQVLDHLKKFGLKSEFLTIGVKSPSNKSKLGKGIFTTTAVPRNTILATVPKNLVVDKELVQHSEIGKIIPWPEETEKKREYRNKAHASLVTFLLHSKENKNPLWYPLLNSLPTDFTNGITMSFDRNAMQYAEGNELALTIHEMKTNLEVSLKNFRELCGKHPGFQIPRYSKCKGVFPSIGNEAYLWIWSSILSRTQYIDKEPFFIPLVDYINFSPRYGEFSVEFSKDETGNFVIRSVTDIPANTEVYLDSGQKRNVDLLTIYGHTQKNNPNLAAITLMLPPEVLKSKGAAYLASHGMKPYMVTDDAAYFKIHMTTDTIEEKLGTEMLPLIRWLSISDEEVTEILKRDPETLIENQLPDDHIEIGITRAAYESLNDTLANYPTTLEQDKKLFESMKGNQLGQDIVTCMMDEKIAYTKLVDVTKELVHVLEVQHAETHPEHGHHHHHEHKHDHSHHGHGGHQQNDHSHEHHSHHEHNVHHHKKH